MAGCTELNSRHNGSRTRRRHDLGRRAWHRQSRVDPDAKIVAGGKSGRPLGGIERRVNLARFGLRSLRGTGDQITGGTGRSIRDTHRSALPPAVAGLNRL